MDKKIVIIGAGPTGLGAAYRLQELGYKNWEIYEKNSFVGGLSSSFKDDAGFTWDIGGHIFFSNYPYFNNLFKKILSREYLSHDRKSYIRLFDRWIPYPFQNNLRYLPKEKLIECLVGLMEVGRCQKSPGNFREWILATFGPGISEQFMFPYNRMVWATPLNKMSADWISQRVSVINIRKVLDDVLSAKDSANWGPNNKFLYPLHGGTGGFFKALTPFIAEKLHLNKAVSRIDLVKKMVVFRDGSESGYDYLITTAPLDIFSKMTGAEKLIRATSLLKSTGVLVVGVGIHKKNVSDKCWMYFPNNVSPFYRVTYLSSYSPCNKPEGDFYSLMCETSYSPYKRENRETIIKRTIDGLVAEGLLSEKDRSAVVSTFLIAAKYSYPVPTLGRDGALKRIHPFLESRGVFSRGRFGAWRYEIGNMDHSLMQGVEVVNRLLVGEKERVFNE